MIEQPLFSDPGVAQRLMLRGVISHIDDDHSLVVRVRIGEEELLICADVLVSSETPLLLRPGDAVLCWMEGDNRERGLILGRIEATNALSPATEPMPVDTPERLVIRAKEELTLLVGDGSITIRKDGKILIKGKDLVSVAQRMNRIKGGAVSIN